MEPGIEIGRWRLPYFWLAALAATLLLLGITGQWLSILTILIVIVVFTVVANWPREVHENGLYLALMSFVGCVVVLGSLQRTAHQGFYAATAQIIPLLFLAMAVGSRLSLLGLQEPDRRVRIVLIYALILGEGYSLDALASGSPGDQTFGIVVGALVAAAVVIVSEIVGRENEKATKVDAVVASDK
jgi:hypothetical protein